jgi:hypothetical protein
LSSQKYRNFSVNWVPLSVILVLGTPKQKMMSYRKLTACLELILARGLASIHIVNMLTMTSKCMNPSGAVLKGPKRSKPQTAKGHVTGILWRSWAGVCIHLT